MTSDPTVDRVAFAYRLLRVDVFDHQAEALRSKAPIIAAAGGRRSGKTATAQIAALHTGFVFEGCQVLVTGANLETAKRFIAECVEMLRQSDLASGAVEDETGLRLSLGNGSELLALPPTPGRIRGFGRRVMLVVVDEAGFAPGQVWRDARYVLLDNRAEGAQAWLVGSPWGEREHFFRDSWQRGVDGDPDFAAFTWPTESNPLVPVEWIKRERARLNSLEAKAELDGEWVDSGIGLFPRDLLDACSAPVEFPDLDSLRGPARGLGGVDFGVTFDVSALAAIYRLPVATWNVDRDDPRPIFGLWVPRKWEPRTPLSEVAGDVLGAFAAWGIFTAEANGVGAMPTEIIGRDMGARQRKLARSEESGYQFNRHETSAPRKARGYGALLGLMEQGRLVLPRDPSLLRQLAGLRFEQGRHGMTHIEAADPGTHDDLADAAMLATGVHAPRADSQGRLRCALERAAEIIGEPRLPDGADDVLTVSTGGGLILPRLPYLASTVGADRLTAPSPGGNWERAERPAENPAIASARAKVAEMLRRRAAEAKSSQTRRKRALWR